MSAFCIWMLNEKLFIWAAILKMNNISNRIAHFTVNVVVVSWFYWLLVCVFVGGNLFYRTHSNEHWNRIAWTMRSIQFHAFACNFSTAILLNVYCALLVNESERPTDSELIAANVARKRGANWMRNVTEWNDCKKNNNTKSANGVHNHWTI